MSRLLAGCAAALCAAAMVAPPAGAQESNAVKLTAAQRANAQIDLITLEASAASPATGLTVTGRIEPGSGGRTVLAAPAAGRIIDLAIFPGNPLARGAAILTLGGPDVAALQRSLREARASATAAEQRVVRDRGLLKEGVIAASRLELSEAAYTAAMAQLRQVTSALPGLSPGSRDGELVLKSPVAGILAGPRLAVGERVEVGDALAVIGASTRLRVALAASAEVARVLQAGDRALVRGRGCEASAVLQAVGVGVEANQTVPVDAVITDPDTCLLPGEAVTATVAPRTAAQGAWALPPRAFVRRGAETFVFVERPGGFEAIAVDAAAAKAGFARAAALRTGDRVAISGSALLKGAWIGIAEDE
jgi:cobalt-zinc-cadmium efflux system membrane fusion protein